MYSSDAYRETCLGNGSNKETACWRGQIPRRCSEDKLPEQLVTFSHIIKMGFCQDLLIEIPGRFFLFVS